MNPYHSENYLKRYLTCFPELHALIGVPQPEKWHPEGDAFTHTMMVLREANERFPHHDLVQWAAICHDLGKALTNKEKWPSHHGHAVLGLKPTVTLLEKFGVTDFETVDCVKFITEFHMHVHDVYKMKASTFVNIFRKAVLITYPKGDHLSLLISLACLGECDHYGRGGVDLNSTYTNPATMLKIFYKIDEIANPYDWNVFDDKNWNKVTNQLTKMFSQLKEEA